MFLWLLIVVLVPTWSISKDYGSISVAVPHSGIRPLEQVSKGALNMSWHLMRRGADQQRPAAVISQQSSQQFSKAERAAIQARSKLGSLNLTSVGSTSAEGEGILNMTGRGFDGSTGQINGTWADASTYFRNKVSECKDLCVRNSECIGFVDRPIVNATLDEPEYPRACVFRAEAQLDAWNTGDYDWYELLVTWSKTADADVSGSNTLDVFDWGNTPNCDSDSAPACNEVCRQTSETDVNTMCSVWSSDRTKFYFEANDTRRSLLHCENYCRDAPACVGFVDVWDNPPYCQMKTSVKTKSVSSTASPRKDFWEMV
eukprot:gnl/MRDRNA2_/MRDRNA2_135538_c0_seq1.p1 gnl/MRDRNA2_/MRDRNA2_135538_c0~~gnl/MRDRNA2_/MRDRNA2_135538_c0_seq1.p1  ORF type:complete len:315 (-),score=36.95 gnl/MRDRNA2_/MRDRNA2_135538_c0_seq1:106-1050(-)